MLKLYRIFFLTITTCLLFSTHVLSQSIEEEISDISISPDNFVSGVGRRCAMDVQKTTGKTVYVYTEKDAGAATTRDIWCVVYSADMIPLISPFRVNNSTNNDQLYPFVLINQNDNSFYVSWQSNHNGIDNDIYAKKISIDITNLTTPSITAAPDIIINNITTGEQTVPILAVDHSQNIVVFSFRDIGNDGGGTSSMGAYMRFMSGSNLQAISNQLSITTTVSLNQLPTAISISNSQIAITYMSNHVAANAYDIYLALFTIVDPPGLAPPMPITISDTRVNNYVSGDQNNSWVTINTTTGEIVVTWSSMQDGSGWGVYSKIYSAPNQVLKDEFLVNSVTVNNELLCKVIWEEQTKQLLYFFHYSVSTQGTLKYRIFDGATTLGQYNPVDIDKDLIGGLDTKNYYNQFYNIIYNSYTNRLHLVYDIYDSYSTYNSKSKARRYIFKHPTITVPSFINSTDLDKNWVHSRNYAEDGTLVSESRDYYNNFGNKLQSQTRNLEEDLIFAEAKVFDKYNKPVINTLPAPIPDKLFTYRSDFITPSASSSSYSYIDFDQPITSSNALGEINNPKPVDNTTSLLGKYYSDNNTIESFVPNSSYPYARSNYNYAIIGGIKSHAIQGELYKMGQGHENKTIVLPVMTNELLHYTTLRKNYFSNSFPTTDIINALKKITIDQDGKSQVAYYDNQANIIAKGSVGGPLFATTTTALNTEFYYCNLSSSGYTSLSGITIEGTGAFEIYAFGGNTVSYPSGGGPYTIQTIPLGSTTQIKSTKPFKVSYKKAITITSPYSYTESFEVIEPEKLGTKYSSIDLHVQVASDVALIAPSWATMEIYNLADGKLEYTGPAVASFPVSTPGYYRVRVGGMPPSTASYTATDITISNKQYYKDMSYYFYDDAGRNIAAVAPKGVDITQASLPKFVTSYKYSSSGRVLREIDPDKGTKEFVYRKDGQLRFSRDSRQQNEAVQTFLYINYDNYGRIIESGEYRGGGACNIVFESHLASTNLANGTKALLNSTLADGGMGATCRYEPTRFFYDIPDGTAPNARIQKYTNGSKVTKTSNDQSTTWYSYDYMGRIEWTQQKITGFISYGSDTKTCDYVYGPKGTLTNMIYQSAYIASERFEHKITYDKNLRLAKVESRKANALYQDEAKYLYYKHGPLKRIELAQNLQGIDYVYTLQGKLKSINHPSLDEQKDPGKDGHTSGTNTGFAKDVFGMHFQYYNSDYVKTGSNIQNTNTANPDYFNGNIKLVRWKTRGQGMGSGNSEELIYNYLYDDKNQLTQAIFGTAAPANESTFINHPDNKYLCSFGYDPNGNMTGMNTANSTGGIRDNFIYENGGLNGTPEFANPVHNRLAGARISGTPNSYYGKFEYDATGRLTKQIDVYAKEKRIKYNALGLVAEVRDEQNILKVSFTYDDRGYRLKKVTYTATGTVAFSTWYVRDISGNILSVYSDNAQPNTYQQTEIPIYGYSKIGAVYLDAGQTNYIYELSDHLGNVRATIKRQKVAGEAEVITWKDYYPYGDVMDNRLSMISSLVPDKYGYQSAYSEKDAETEWNSFDLRMYNTRLGKFLSGDPYSQYWSSYMAMGNNPISIVDPDGGTGSGYDGGMGGGYGGAPGAGQGQASTNGAVGGYYGGGMGGGGSYGSNGINFNPGAVNSSSYNPGTMGSGGYNPNGGIGNQGNIRIFGIGPSPTWGVIPSDIPEPYFNSGKTVAMKDITVYPQLRYNDEELSAFAGEDVSDYSYEYKKYLSNQLAWKNNTNGLYEFGEVMEVATIILASVAVGPESGGSRAVITEEVVAAKGGMTELSSLNPTHYITKSESVMKRFVSGVKADGAINESISFVEHNGSKFIVDGHHRFFAAQKLGIQNVPVKQVQLPFRGYQTTSDLILSGKQPGWWKFYKP